ncbi:MAG: DNA methyltransferase [Acidobacteria bacterium]|nr:DNA methyltransferase [Acidobacteriota bacterium]
MKTAINDNLRQRADYTHKYNLRTGRHGWLRLTPAYSVKIVEELIAAVGKPVRVFDPFCGTATTGLSAAYHGHLAASTEINPFLVWLGQAKTDHYSQQAISRTLAACTEALGLVKRNDVAPVPEPPIHNIERWWPERTRAFLRALRAAIDEVTASQSAEQTLLLVAFCRTLIALSNVAFNHQSMSFKNETDQLSLDVGIDAGLIFREDVNFVLRGAAENPSGSCMVIEMDARDLSGLANKPFGLVITSPPYANRMSYIRELRPYMYWLGFLVDGHHAGLLDWKSIGGTWGIATSRLLEWKSKRNGYRCKFLKGILERIAHKDHANGKLLANYVAKYFEDMFEHLTELRTVLADDARVHYILGNSSFYRVLLPVEQIYADMLRELGFTDVSVRPLRKRNSKMELVEFDVSASWKG